MIIPTLAVVGRKNTGKTSLVEFIVSGLNDMGYKVMTAKHVSEKRFSVDSEGTDTWRHREAGANPVFCVSENEIAVIMKRTKDEFSVKDIFRFVTKESDLLILEGFSRWILSDKEIAKIVLVKNNDEYRFFCENTKGRILGIYSINPTGNQIQKIEDAKDDILEKTRRFLIEEKEVSDILSRLPMLDCGKCGFDSCLNFAREIHNGKAKIEDCSVVSAKEELSARIEVNGKEIPLQPFVSKIIYNTVAGMVSSLKRASVKGDEHLLVKLESRRTETRIQESKD
ncbi:MAG: molybdopterin-guanine dinucleotide biosynthesis protein B, partial [Candidatus Hodarchaeota archaeon]